MFVHSYVSMQTSSFHIAPILSLPSRQLVNASAFRPAATAVAVFAGISQIRFRTRNNSVLTAAPAEATGAPCAAGPTGRSRQNYASGPHAYCLSGPTFIRALSALACSASSSSPLTTAA